MEAKRDGEYTKTGKEVTVDRRHAQVEIRKVTKMKKGEVVELDYIVYKTGVTSTAITELCRNYKVDEELLLASNRKVKTVEKLLSLKEIMIPYFG